MIQIEKRAFPGGGETLLFFTCEGNLKKNEYFNKLDATVDGKLTKKAQLHDFTGKKDEYLMVEGSLYGHIICYGIGAEKELTPAALREYLASAMQLCNNLKTSSVHVFYPPALSDFNEAGKQIALGFYLSQYRFDKYKGKEMREKAHGIKDLYIFFDKEAPELTEGIEAGAIIARGIKLTRDLVNEPASHVHPATLAEEAARIAGESGGRISVSVLDENECRKLGMGAFLGVAAGSDLPPKFIILTYKPREAKGKKICFVGKSITFDSGGLSLKPAKAMEDMKIDMAGGASVLGVFQALADGIEVNREVIGILPACENMPSGRAMRPGDVVTAVNGKTVEVVNTDAEGRLALADAVSYAEKTFKPDLIIDFATLTGACMVALGEDIAGIFGNNEEAVRKFFAITRKEQEPAWELPFYKPYLDLIKSDIAQLKNVSGKGYGGAITAALFIGEFVKNTKWIHVDIAGPAHNSGASHGTVGRGGTGWGVLSIISLLQQY